MDSCFCCSIFLFKWLLCVCITNPAPNRSEAIVNTHITWSFSERPILLLVAKCFVSSEMLCHGQCPKTFCDRRYASMCFSYVSWPTCMLASITIQRLYGLMEIWNAIIYPSPTVYKLSQICRGGSCSHLFPSPHNVWISVYPSLYITTPHYQAWLV